MFLMVVHHLQEVIGDMSENSLTYVEVAALAAALASVRS